NIRVVEAERPPDKRPDDGAGPQRDADDGVDDGEGDFDAPRTDELLLPQTGDLGLPAVVKGPATSPPGVAAVLKRRGTRPPGTTAAIYGPGTLPPDLAGGPQLGEPPRGRGRRLVLGAAAVLLIAAAALAARQLWPRVDPKVLLVAPAQVLGQTEGAEYFGQA